MYTSHTRVWPIKLQWCHSAHIRIWKNQINGFSKVKKHNNTRSSALYAELNHPFVRDDKGPTSVKCVRLSFALFLAHVGFGKQTLPDCPQTSCQRCVRDKFECFANRGRYVSTDLLFVHHYLAAKINRSTLMEKCSWL